MSSYKYTDKYGIWVEGKKRYVKQEVENIKIDDKDY